MRARISDDETSIRRVPRRRAGWIPDQSCHGSANADPDPSERSSTTNCTSRSNCSGARQRSNADAASAPSNRKNSASGQRATYCAAVSTMNDNPDRSISIGSTSICGKPAKQRRAIASRCTASDAPTPLRGWIPAGTTCTRFSDNRSAASESASRCPTCGGSKLPPKMPMRSGTPDAACSAPTQRGGGTLGGATGVLSGGAITGGPQTSSTSASPGWRRCKSSHVSRASSAYLSFR